MLWFYTAGLLLGIFAVIIWRNYRKKDIQSVFGSQRRYRIYSCFLRVGILFERNIKKDKGMLRDLYPAANINDLLIRSQVREGRRIILSWFGIHLFGFVLSIAINDDGCIYDGRFITRDYDDGNAKTVIAAAHGENLNINDIPVEVRDKLAEGDERSALFERGKAYVLDAVRGNNVSLDYVQYALNLVTGVPDTSLTVTWNLDMAPLIMSDGAIETSQVTENGAEQTIKAILDYGGEQQIMEINLKIFPKMKTEDEKIYDEIMSDIQIQNDMNSDVFELPENVHGEKIYWTEQRKYTAEKAVAVAVILTGALYVYGAGEKKRKLKIRSEQMSDSYPKFIHKLVLLTGAGLNMRHALQMMAEKETYTRKGETDYVCEEIKVTLKLMQQGIPEIQAYEMFGRHCGERYYVKLSAMMIQCVKKGAAGMNELMSGMADEAMMIHRDQVRKKSEQAGTKLLLPMGMILIVVFMILVVPAFLSMNL